VFTVLKEPVGKREGNAILSNNGGQVCCFGRKRIKAVRLVFGLSIFTAILSCGPVIYGWLYTPYAPELSQELKAQSEVYRWLHAPRDSVYMGSTKIYQADQMYFYSVVKQGYSGSWLYDNVYSSGEPSPILWYPLYMGLGHLAKLSHSLVFAFTNISMPDYVCIPIVFHVVRFLLIVALIMSLYGLTGLITRSPSQRIWIVSFAAFSGGFLIKECITESHTLQSWFFYPHFVASQLLYIWILWGFLLSMNKRSSWFWPAGLCAAGGFGLGWVHPFDLLPLSAIGVVFFFSIWTIRRRFPLRLFLCGCLCALSASCPMAYFYLVTMKIPYFSMSFYANNILRWGYWLDPINYLELYLIGAFVLGLPALWVYRRKARFLFVFVWVLVGTVALWAPVASQRRLVEGLPLGFAFAWVIGLNVWIVNPLSRYLKNRYPADILSRNRIRLLRNGIFLLAFLFLLPRTAYIYYRACFLARHPVCYEKKGVIRAYEWMARNTARRSVVWSHAETGNRIPYFSGNRTFIGQAPMIDYRLKLNWTKALESQTLPVETFRRIVRDYSIEYLFWVVSEDEKAGDLQQYDPDTVRKPVYDAEGVRIYPINSKALQAEGVEGVLRP